MVKNNLVINYLTPKNNNLWTEHIIIFLIYCIKKITSSLKHRILKRQVGHPPRSPITKDQEKELSEMYYNDNNFFGRDKLYQLARSKDIDVSRRQLYDWLEKQNVHQLYKQTKKTKTIRSTILKQPLSQIGIDLIDMQHYEYDKYNYILTCIDLFSKKAFALPLKNKDEETVYKAMYKLIKNDLSGVHSIRSDNGSEFINHKFKK